MKTRLTTVLLASLVIALPLGAAPAADPVEFFKTRVRPVFASQCFTCHTNLKMGGLQLDSREHILKGGNSGPAIVPGNPDQSVLIQAVSHTHPRLKMPLEGKLTDEQIHDLRAWVESGAHWADEEAPAPAKVADSVVTPDQRKFWSFQPVRKPPVPEVRDENWPKSAIDNFILSRLEAKGLKPVRPAGKRTLIRRATLDLIGLPPTPEEVQVFVNDSAPDAFRKVIERLLASPHYGERWGRFWLDVARYADEDALGLSAEPFPNAFRYRDWVIEAFNNDMPYDLFVKAQIAGDLLEKQDQHDLRAGLGLFALGPWYHKIVEPQKARADERHDRVDVLTRGFLGLTIACARCHNHKYDPISMKDYYALAGVFANTEYQEYPLVKAEAVNAYKAQQKKITDQQEQINKLLDSERKRASEDLAKELPKYLMAVWEVQTTGSNATAVAERERLDCQTVERLLKYLASPEKAHPFLNKWDQLVASRSTREAVLEFAKDFQKLVVSILDEKKSIEEYNQRILEEAKKSKDPYDIYCKGCNVVTKSLQRDKYVLWTDLFGKEQRTLEKQSGVFYYEKPDRFLPAEQKSEIDSMRAELTALKKALPEHYPFLHVLSDVQEPMDLKLHLRGDPYNLGEPVPRRFVGILSKPEPAVFHNGSGRLELAEAIANPENPLTARVIVNRIWEHHFGAGIVRTASNFGLVGDRPSHPELLDYLAARLIENHWSIKSLHREIMLSATYKLSSDDSAENYAKDPETRLLWRANRPRLEIEPLRDSMLFVAGNLDLKVGGPAVEWKNGNHRRTVYGKVSRFRMERILSLFDFPDPSITCDHRATTNVPLQRLFFLNSELVTEQAKGLAERVQREAGVTDLRIQRAYELLFGRPANEAELRAGARFLQTSESDGSDSGSAWQQYALVLLSSNEFSFVD